MLQPDNVFPDPSDDNFYSSRYIAGVDTAKEDNSPSVIRIYGTMSDEHERGENMFYTVAEFKVRPQEDLKKEAGRIARYFQPAYQSEQPKTTDMSNNVQYITRQELEARRKEEAFEKECKQKAADACYLLRQQLRNQEMNSHITNMYTPGSQELPFVFVSRQELKKELENRTKNLIHG